MAMRGVWGGLAVWLALGASAGAVESQPGEAPVEIHGFVSPGYIATTHKNNYLARSAGKGSFELAEVGINFTKSITDDLRVGLQLFARDLGPVGNYSPKVDWFYLDYRWRDWLGLRAGRVKLPFGLYNDTSDIDQARVPILLPQSVYPISNRDLLLAQTGGEVYGYATLGAAGALDYRFYGGTVFLELPDSQPGPLQVTDLTIPFIVGGRLLWEAPLEGLRVGGSIQKLRLDTRLSLGGSPVEVELPATLWVGSVEYAAHDLLFAAEYSRWHVESESSDPSLYPDSKSVSERAYAMASYRVNRWLTPGAYYSIYYPNVEIRKGRTAQQQDIAGTVRFDINDHWLVKLEAHYMIGRAALSGALNDGKPPATLEGQWMAFLAKTTAYF
jgi:hypothetical protein